jgi:hypothetical protein
MLIDYCFFGDKYFKAIIVIQNFDDNKVHTYLHITLNKINSLHPWRGFEPTIYGSGGRRGDHSATPPGGGHDCF